MILMKQESCKRLDILLGGESEGSTGVIIVLFCASFGEWVVMCGVSADCKRVGSAGTREIEDEVSIGKLNGFYHKIIHIIM